ncbi:hypothetical protein BGZ49_002644, partial [Haplosporangium sp. Z 27]
ITEDVRDIAGGSKASTSTKSVPAVSPIPVAGSLQIQPKSFTNSSSTTDIGDNAISSDDDFQISSTYGKRQQASNQGEPSKRQQLASQGEAEDIP